MLVGFSKVLFWALELQPQPVVWLWLFKWTSRFQTGHKRLRFIQSLIIEILFKHALSALNMWFLLMPTVSCRRTSAAKLHLFVGSRGWGSGWTALVLHLFQKMSYHRGWKSPCKSCYLAPGQGIKVSAINKSAIYGHMLHFLCHRPNPPLLCCPALANILCIWAVSRCPPPP